MSNEMAVTVPETFEQFCALTREQADAPCAMCGDRVRYHFDGWNGNKLIGYCEDRIAYARAFDAALIAYARAFDAALETVKARGAR